MVGCRPLVHVDRSHFDTDLELDGEAGLDVALLVEDREAFGLLLFGYTPLEEEDTRREVDCVWWGYGGGLVHALPVGEGSDLFVRWAVGLSWLYLNFEDDDLDTHGLGVFGRVGAGLMAGERVGVELYGDLHGWAGQDADRSQAAWAAGLGASLFVLF